MLINILIFSALWHKFEFCKLYLLNYFHVFLFTMFIITKRQSFIIRYVLLSCITPCVPVMMLRMNAREKYNIEVWILFFSCSQRSTNKHRGMPLSLSTYSEMALVLRTAPHHYTRWPMVNDQWPLPLTLYCGIGLSEKVTPGGTNVVTNQGINNGWRPLVLLLHLLCRNPGDLTNLINFTNFTNLTNLTNLANLISFINLTNLSEWSQTLLDPLELYKTEPDKTELVLRQDKRKDDRNENARML